MREEKLYYMNQNNRLKKNAVGLGAASVAAAGSIPFLDKPVVYSAYLVAVGTAYMTGCIIHRMRHNNKTIDNYIEE